MKIFVVIPSFNESRRIRHVLDGLMKETSLTVIVVDDGSSDSTLQVAKDHIERSHKKDTSRLVALRHRCNLGKGAALKTGCEAAFLMGADAVIVMDADGQHHVDDLPKFIDLLETSSYDIIFGTRNLTKKVPFVRLAGNKVASLLVSLMFRIYVSDLICGYRAFTKKAYQQIIWQSMGYGVETEMVIRTGKKGLRSCEVLVQTIYHDKYKGVTLLDALGILFNVFKWRVTK